MAGPTLTTALAPASWRRLTRSLKRARIAYFEYRPGRGRGPAANGGTLRWSGARFGIDGLGAGADLPALLAAVVPADRQTLLHVLALDRPGSARSGEFRIERPGGGLVDLFCDAYAEPLRAADPDLQAELVFGIVQDVTVQHRFENELSAVVRRNQMLLAVIDACPIGVIAHEVTPSAMPLVYANRRFTELTGHELADVVGRDLSFLQGPGTEPEAVAAIAHAIGQGETIETRLTGQRPDGTPFMTRLMLVPVHEAGRLCGFIGLLHDLTQEAQRQEAERHRQKMEALGRMTGGVAHEINNLLQPVALLGQDLLDRRLVEGTGAGHLEIMLDCCLKARQIIGDMLAFSRPARQRARAWKAAALLEESLRLVRQALPQDVTVTVQATGEPADISVERTAFTQMLLNLAGNAAAAMEGRGEITIVLDDVTWPDGRRWTRLRLSDSGCGMDPATLERAFEPFFTTKPVGQGTGLGLPVVYGLVSEMGGSITLDSAPGQGTTATVLLPADKGEPTDGVDTGG
ncbi:Histidine kinase [Rhodovastum atsumiense]|uniref:histidine kinase n=1 Tax=Rhodovastum atsumiense TaxID=504468 RepID=A0A5M6J083_9PROT|nr:PAS domain-containing sensor histidine kinase [Rhodovastum atsumiense]KAA5613921.1 PAS domain-containing protein [Rhodovastum atsumiense]CAH2602055.1 Histidine kinase [Rhodovastum atsumiense]